jgi:hypothetical protein
VNDGGVALRSVARLHPGVGATTPGNAEMAAARGQIGTVLGQRPMRHTGLIVFKCRPVRAEYHEVDCWLEAEPVRHD